MGWAGEIEDELLTATRNVDKYPKDTLAWLLAAEAWNHWALEAVSDGNEWEFDDSVMPANCEFEPLPDELDLQVPQIDIPEYDMAQSLRQM